jgi:hypothetical protein
MGLGHISIGLNRRTLIKAAAVAGVAQITSPFVMAARAADEVKIGLDNPLTGTYAALGVAIYLIVAGAVGLNEIYHFVI